MNLDDFATPLASKNNFIKASFGGFSGSGKSRTATEFVTGAYKYLGLSKPVLIIDNEKGARFLEPHFRKAGVPARIVDSVHLSDVLKAFQFMKSGAVDFLFIDSLTKVWDQYIQDYMAKFGTTANGSPRKSFMTLKDWGQLIPSWDQKFAKKFVEVEGCIVFTGRGGYTYDSAVNPDNGKLEFIKNGVKMKVSSGTPFEPDLNIWMEQAQKLDEHGKPNVWREATVLKDRSALIDGKVFQNPTFGAFKPVLDYLTEIPKGDVATGKGGINLAPSEEYPVLKKAKDDLSEEITMIFNAIGLGTGKEDKQIKTVIFEKVFGVLTLSSLMHKEIDAIKKDVLILKTFRRLSENTTLTIDIINQLVIDAKKEAGNTNTDLFI